MIPDPRKRIRARRPKVSEMRLRLLQTLVTIIASQAGWAWGGGLPDEFSGAEVYAQHCARCHTQSVGGAPRPGNHEDWRERAVAGRADLLLSVLKGKGGMPPKGGNASLSVSEANAALDFMLPTPARR